MSDLPDAPRKPRIALMGEFSAGKSTLTNLLLGSHPLPVRVTATRLPPVTITYGEERAVVALKGGAREEITLDALDAVGLNTARRIELTLPSEALELCDLVDMPGISDPNMPADVWQAVLPELDGVIWCTSATQAWRQSEAAFWSILGPKISGPKVLLMTHADKLTSARDRARVLKRLERETEGQFDAIFPIALPQALAAGEDMEIWHTSGADVFVEQLIDMLLKWQSNVEAQEEEDAIRQEARTTEASPLDVIDLAALAPRSDLRRPGLRVLTPRPPVEEIPLVDETEEEAQFADPDPDQDTARILPRRVRPSAEAASPRPARARLVRSAP